MTDYRLTPTEATRLLGKPGLVCEHAATDRVGTPVSITDSTTTWSAIIVGGTENHIETTPTHELTFHLQPLEYYRYLLHQFANRTEAARITRRTTRSLRQKAHRDRAVDYWDILALERALQIKQEDPET